MKTRMLKMPQIPHWRSKHLFGEDVWPTVHFLYLSLFLKNHFHIKTHELNGNRIGKTVEYAEKKLFLQWLYICHKIVDFKQPDFYGNAHNSCVYQTFNNVSLWQKDPGE